jgi:hypothetical protein
VNAAVGLHIDRLPPITEVHALTVVGLESWREMLPVAWSERQQETPGDDFAGINSGRACGNRNGIRRSGVNVVAGSRLDNVWPMTESPANHVIFGQLLANEVPADASV